MVFVLIISMLSLSARSLAQSPGNHFEGIWFGNLDTAVTSFYLKDRPAATWKNVLAKPRLYICCNGRTEVTGYILSFMPKGKDFRGPYVIKGAEFTREIRNIIREHLMDNPSCKVFVENIRVIGPDGIERVLPGPMTFTVTP